VSREKREGGKKVARANPQMTQLIKSQMVLKKLDQAKLAAKTGMCEKTVSNKINRRNDFTLAEIVLFMNALGLSPDVFIKT